MGGEDWLGNSHSPGSHQHQPLLREEHPVLPFELNLMLDHMFAWVLLVFIFPFLKCFPYFYFNRSTFRMGCYPEHLCGVNRMPSDRQQKC